MTTPNTNLDRIAKLLNQAENTDNEAEAEAFMTAAQRLATLYSVDLNRARMSTKEKEQYSKPAFKQIRVGEAGKKGLRTLQALVAGIAEANDLKVTYANNGTSVNLFGFPEDIAVTEALYASLYVQMVEASERYLATGDYKKDEVYSEGYYKWVDRDGNRISAREASYAWDADQVWVSGGYKPKSKLTARLDFQQSFADRVASRLWRAKHDAEQELQLKEHRERVTDETGSLSEEFIIWYYENFGLDLEKDGEERERILNGGGRIDGERFAAYMESEQGASTVPTGSELVLADKKQAVREFYQATSNAKGSWNGYGSKGGGAASAGYQAGGNARLSGQGSLPGARKAIA